jgi:aldose sugar dehydrogenase
MRMTRTWLSRACFAVAVVAAAVAGIRIGTQAQGASPQMLDRSLDVRAVISGLNMPIGLAFLGANDMFVIEKDTGRVQRVVDGAMTGTVLDLGVNNNSERGLLGIALHPDFPRNPGVYLYWTCRSTAPPSDPFFPDERRCLDSNMFAADSGDILQVPLLGNRVDRFVWDGSRLSFHHNVIMLRAFQNDASPVPAGQDDAAQPPRGNHNGGVIRFGPDRKLYIVIGDNGRRGWLQNLQDGPVARGDDDQFGGPEPDDAHLTGVILRLEDDGRTPNDNPFIDAGRTMGGEVGSNIMKIYAYGLRNNFGMAFDPFSGFLWEQENGDDSFSELNRVEPGFNSGWAQIMGPSSRLAQFKAIETTVTPNPPDPFAATYFGLQQLRWSPANIANTAQEAMSRLFVIRGSHFSEPEFSWRFEVAPGAIGFIASPGLGPRMQGNLLMAAARPFLEGGHLFRFILSGDRREIVVEDPRIGDRVADNRNKWEITESQTLLAGRNFGVGTHIETGPNGNVFVVSLSNGAVYEIFRAAR